MSERDIAKHVSTGELLRTGSCVSQQDFTKHVSSGELLQTGSEFVCNICSSPLGQQPMQHIQGSTHKNAVFLQALSQPLKYKALYNALPHVVQEAHGTGVVTVKDSKFDCGPCKMSFTGEIPLIEHLTSSKHRKKEAAQVPPIEVTPPTSGPSVEQPTSPIFSDVKNSASSEPTPAGQPNLMIPPVVTNAIRDGHVKVSGSTDLQCTLCTGTKVITGVEPMRQHLEGKDHKKSVQALQLWEVNQRAETDAPHQPQPSYPTRDSNQQDSSQLAFDLRSLTQNFTLNVNFSSPYLPTRNASAGANNEYDPDAGPVPMKFTEKVEAEQSAQPCNTYKNSSSPRGIVVIFNYIFMNNLESLRKGARKDHENLQAVFTKLGYEVWPINIDLTRQETLNKLDEVRKCPKLRKVDSLITVFLSHGGPAENEFLAFDEQTISVDEILYTKFTDQECPAMKGKPKLFIFNYCRGKVTPSNPVQFDNWSPNTHQLEAPSDVAVIQATLPHFMAGRYPDTGTIFVCEFCKVLEQNSGGMELVEIIHETSNQMRKDTNGNTPTVTSIHFRKFKFM